MSRNFEIYKNEFFEILDSAKRKISTIKPSEWAEKKRVMTSEVSSVKGKFKYTNTPYTREIVDCLDPNHPARKIAVIKGAQIGYSSGVVENGIGYIIDQAPGNIIYLIGHEDNFAESVKKVDTMLFSTGVDKKIGNQQKRERNTKSGNTDKLKEFNNGYLRMGIAKLKAIQNFSVQYGFIDDFDRMKQESKEDGSITALIEMRFSSFAKKMKLFYISTPNLKESSNIEPEYLMGDQRKYYIPCQCCGEMIRIEWTIKSELNDSVSCGIMWDMDGNKLVDGSVRYKCYKCEGEFDDSKKMDWLNEGHWKPTAEPKEPGYYSYHISALYAPTFMFGWERYVRKYLKACPPGQPRIESEYKTFVNTVLGETYKEQTESLKANQLQKNTLDYPVGIAPDKVSKRINNGNIILITVGVDLNGKDDSHPNHNEDDARLDWEIVAYSESGATYSIDHGSIGTFIPGQTKKQKRETDRVKWTYKFGVKNSVWPEFDKLISRRIKTQSGKSLPIAFVGLDSGIYTDYAYQFVQNRINVVALKGKDEDKYVPIFKDTKSFKNSQEKPNKLYLVETNHTKDVLARKTSLNWDSESNEPQPPGYMNFPIPSNGKYLYKNYFSHFEAEEKQIDDRGKFIWKKKPGNPQNHLYDCRLYADVAKDIFIEKILKPSKIEVNWENFVSVMRGLG